MRLPRTSVPRVVALWVVIVSVALLGASRASAADEASLDATHAAVARFEARFTTVGPALAENLDRLYTEDVHFRDPIAEVTGLVALRRYFERFAATSASARFEITDEVVQPGQAAIFWTMVMKKKDGGDGRPFQGVSHVKTRDRIYEERDYFDLGEAVYDQVPVVGWLTRLVRAWLD